MTIILEKNKPISLINDESDLKKLVVILGWDDAIINGKPVDCDVSVFMLDVNGKLPQDEFFVFYNNKTSIDASVEHSGDKINGSSGFDDEIITVDLSIIDRRINFLYFVTTIHESEERGHHFGHLTNASIKIQNAKDRNVLCQYNLTESFSGHDSLIIASISRNGSNWDVEGLGQGFSGGLGTLLELYQ